MTISTQLLMSVNTILQFSIYLPLGENVNLVVNGRFCQVRVSPTVFSISLSKHEGGIASRPFG